MTRRTLAFGVAIVCAGVACTIGFARARTSLTLTAPDGAFAVGTRSIALRGLLPGDAVIPISVWYPAQPMPTRASYGAGAGRLRDILKNALVRTHASPNAPVAQGISHLPMLLSFASWGGYRNQTTALAEDLASHGFVVVALDDVSVDRPADDRLRGEIDLSSDRAYEATLALADRKRDAAVQRGSAVLDRILESPGALGESLRSLVDVRKVGAFGYSFGGAVAYALGQHDPRVRAVMNLDGWLFRDPAEAHREPVIPYLFIGTDQAPVSEADLHASDPVQRHTAMLDRSDEEFARQERLRGAVFATIPHTDHASFSDDISFGFHERKASFAEPKRVERIICARAISFFDRTLHVAKSIKADIQVSKVETKGPTRNAVIEGAAPSPARLYSDLS